jgi:hypothetical protein
VDLDDTSSNVYALFPGIDTTPFGRAEAPEGQQNDACDAGWSADVPDRTLFDEVAVPAELGSPPPVGRQGGSAWGRRRRLALPVGASIALALLIGVALAAGRALLLTPSRHASGAMASAGHMHARDVQEPSSVNEKVKNTIAIHQTRTPEQKQHRPAGHRGRPSRPRHQPNVLARSGDVAYAPSTGPAPTATSSYTPTPVEPVSSSAASDSTARAPASSDPPVNQPAGPSGLGQQIGTSCDPKCK